jgi:protoheme IX farnesyltransferase
MNELEISPEKVRAGAQLRRRSSAYLSLIKSLQTGLLLITGLAGFTSAVCPATHPGQTLALTLSLFLAISGSTVLNMVYDRDIDALMPRTQRRPLPSGRISAQEATLFGAALSIAGLALSLALSPFYAGIVFAGWFFDVIVYTTWLKRRTPWAILWGGIAGGMPALAGRVLAVGRIDWVGLALATAVLLWIPTHIVTFSVRYHRDYDLAGIPTFPSRYGARRTQLLIAFSSILAALAMGVSAVGLGMSWGCLRVLAVLGTGLLVLAATSVLRPSARMNFGLFKYASVYMLSSMLLVVIEAI